ncbi:hypothetical protein [Sphingopyxis sp. RIFCSPHIGHO2_12_FULL_65_19]|uniref:hypothetical protein n=1 Tax=Sphingopyxis sp. RIFCSPHIGHO2_12_FULL_65_19 TaxID=1802172 RepID=UPI0008C15854|nr:hypothetical protein [Sphingopyxis sp. RIFCSPHIGHO2_12_FULL_65_19]OHD08055.1 MAG: hypothetical protein A3E77_05515 [Sphingopyxis sp. RIFCSPHIGHO2_12_FULL_65_19]
MAAVSQRSASALWIALLTAASMVTTLALGCATPFPSLAALAAVHMRRRDGLALMLLAWAASQFVGFVLLGYPRDGSTLAWGAGLGTAAVGAMLASHAALRAADHRSVAARLSLAYAAGFTAFKGVILLWALVLGGLHTAMAPDLLAEQFVRNAAILIGLYAVYRALVAAGVPPPLPMSAAATT